MSDDMPYCGTSRKHIFTVRLYSTCHLHIAHFPFPISMAGYTCFLVYVCTHECMCFIFRGRGWIMRGFNDTASFPATGPATWLLLRFETVVIKELLRRAGASQPKLRCAGADMISGVASCRLVRSTTWAGKRISSRSFATMRSRTGFGGSYPASLLRKSANPLHLPCPVLLCAQSP